jgi:hypothetical protein
LADVIREVQNTLPGHISSQPPGVLLGLSQVLGNFQETVDQCWVFLQERASHGAQDGALNNLGFQFFGVRDELNRLRDRVAFLNIKVGMTKRAD